MLSPHRLRTILVASIIGCVVAAPAAQSPSNPAFEVASIKPNKSGGAFSTLGFPPGGRFSADNVTLRDLIRAAHGTPEPLDPTRLIGGPGWIDSDRFDIVAKAPGAADPQQLLLMLRSLLAERFKVAVHNDSRELPVYALVMARSDGRLGPQLKRADECTPSGSARGTPPPSTGVCGGRGSPGRLQFGGVPLSIVVAQPVWSRELRRVVVDRTGLTGAFEGTLEWTPADMPSAPAGPAPPDAPPPPRPDGPSIFAAVQEQLGLKLEPSQAPLDVVVIDRAERPTED
jgi:uncharacterized protein (TIGR03435 family)